MKGVQYVVDDQGDKKAVLIDLQENKELWEDFFDAALVAERADDPRDTLETVERRLTNPDQTD